MCARSFPHTPYALGRALAHPCAYVRQCHEKLNWRALAQIGAFTGDTNRLPGWLALFDFAINVGNTAKWSAWPLAAS